MKNRETVAVSTYDSIITTIIFLILKLTDTIQLSWFFVFLPLIVSVVWFFLQVFIFFAREGMFD